MELWPQLKDIPLWRNAPLGDSLLAWEDGGQWGVCVYVAFLSQLFSSLFISSVQIVSPSQELESTVHWRMH